MHRGATTTPTMRRTIRTSKEPVRVLAERLGINPKTVMKWRHRTNTADRSSGSQRSGVTVLSPPEQEMCLAFRKATMLPLDDCLYALQLSLPHLTRATLHRLYKQHGISRLSDVQNPSQAGLEPSRQVPGDNGAQRLQVSIVQRDWLPSGPGFSFGPRNLETIGEEALRRARLRLQGDWGHGLLACR